MTKSLKLIVEQPTYDRKDYSLVSESNSDGVKHLYIEGPYTEAEARNKNGRVYPLVEMVEQINEFNENYVSQNRALGELEHPEYPNINAERACHMITKLYQDGNVFIGKSKILESTPKGQIVAGLLKDGVQLGISSRSLGAVDENGIVNEFKLCTFDVVSDPSCHKAFVNGILESREFICNVDPKMEKTYEAIDKALDESVKLSRSERQNMLYSACMNFFNSLK